MRKGDGESSKVRREGGLKSEKGELYEAGKMIGRGRSWNIDLLGFWRTGRIYCTAETLRAQRKTNEDKKLQKKVWCEGKEFLLFNISASVAVRNKFESLSSCPSWFRLFAFKYLILVIFIFCGSVLTMLNGYLERRGRKKPSFFRRHEGSFP